MPCRLKYDYGQKTCAKENLTYVINTFIVLQDQLSSTKEVIVLAINPIEHKKERSLQLSWHLTLFRTLQGDPKLAPPIGRRSGMTWSFSDKSGLKYN